MLSVVRCPLPVALRAFNEWALPLAWPQFGAWLCWNLLGLTMTSVWLKAFRSLRLDLGSEFVAAFDVCLASCRLRHTVSNCNRASRLWTLYSSELLPSASCIPAFGWSMVSFGLVIKNYIFFFFFFRAFNYIIKKFCSYTLEAQKTNNFSRVSSVFSILFIDFYIYALSSLIIYY